MNVLFVSHYDNYYGSSRSLMSLLIGLQEYDIVPFVVVPKGGGFTDALSEHNISYKITAMPWWVSRNKLSIRKKFSLTREIFRSVKTIRQLVQEWQIDLIYTNSSVIPVGRLAALIERVPHIWHVREFGDLDFNLRFILPNSLSNVFILTSSSVICNATAVKNYHFDGSKKKGVRVVYNGVATKEEFDHNKSLRLENKTDDRFTYLIIGSISPKKGQETAIRAIAELRHKGINSNLVITGNGRKDYIDLLKNLVKELGITDLIKFTGFLINPYEVYSKVDCLLMCSEYEAFGRVTAEAMSACLPVIGKNSGGTPEIIKQNETGILYDNFYELVDAMERCYKNPEWAREMGLNGWQKAKNCFNIEDYSANVFEIIQSVMK